MPNPGHLTPSTFDALMTNNRKGDGMGETALTVVDQLVLDWLGVPRLEVTAAAMEWGKDNEDAARLLYAITHDCKVIKPDEPRFSKSHPYVCGEIDGLIVGADKGIEIKCPYTPRNHLAYNQNLSNYKYQIQGYMWIYGLQQIDFVSYSPLFPEKHQLKIITIDRQDDLIAALQQRCEQAYQLAADKYYEMDGD